MVESFMIYPNFYFYEVCEYMDWNHWYLCHGHDLIL